MQGDTEKLSIPGKSTSRNCKTSPRLSVKLKTVHSTPTHFKTMQKASACNSGSKSNSSATTPISSMSCSRGRPLQCTHCQAVFSAPSSLQEHVRIHTGRNRSRVNIAKQSLLSPAPCDVICIPTQGGNLPFVTIAKQSSLGPAAYDSMCAPTQGKGLSLVSIVKQRLLGPATYDCISPATCDSICVPTQGGSLSFVTILKQSSVRPAAYDGMCASTQGRAFLLWVLRS